MVQMEISQLQLGGLVSVKQLCMPAAIISNTTLQIWPFIHKCIRTRIMEDTVQAWKTDLVPQSSFHRVFVNHGRKFHFLIPELYSKRYSLFE
ncbi:hypothetical protein ILYODFUR_014817 [Ilyodon furcidens]|uniref:Uncharacterized protein n=1 Tax=Ilyodon furcidens TaxID=33524 RepID=A0ABV0TIP9_9TELE